MLNNASITNISATTDPMTQERSAVAGEPLQLSGRKVFVTGGAGFIGTTLCNTLVNDNQIVIFDNGHRNALRYTELLDHRNVRFINGDVLDYNAVFKGMEGCDMVVHLAAIAGVDTVINHPVLTMKMKLLGTYHVLEAALQHNAQRVIDFSTSEVFGSYAFPASRRPRSCCATRRKSIWKKACFARLTGTVSIWTPFNRSNDSHRQDDAGNLAYESPAHRRVGIPGAKT